MRLRAPTTRNKLILVKLDPNANYVLLVDPTLVHIDPSDLILGLAKSFKGKIQIMYVDDVTRAIRFVEIPQLKKND
jgi:PIN domain nuclease of toxin-antitoxin system